MRPLYCVLLFSILLLSVGRLGNQAAAQPGAGEGLSKIGDNTDKTYHRASRTSIALTVTNFGTIGDLLAYSSQPSCEYPGGSRIEHLTQGALWVGAEIRSSDPNRDGQVRVTTGSHEYSSTLTGKGYEFKSLPGTGVAQRSTDTKSQYYNSNAVSFQDFVATYADTTPLPQSSDLDARHVPLGITVRQESYAWDFPYADFFVILSYTIVNTGRDSLDSVHVGLWSNGIVRNTNNVRIGAPGFYAHSSQGYVDSLRMMYTYDYDGIPVPPAANSYLGIKLLGCKPFPSPDSVSTLDDLSKRSFFNSWQFRGQGSDAWYFYPQDDALLQNNARSRFDRLTSRMPQDRISRLRTQAWDPSMTTMLSVGPFPRLRPGDSMNVVFAVMCARKDGNLPAFRDLPEQRKSLYLRAKIAQQTYDGEDINGNNMLDPGEDLNGNGRLDHYQLPQPPAPPKMRLEIEESGIAVYWDKVTSEESTDPLTRVKDFEGYRVYRSNAGADVASPENLLVNLPIAGEFDVVDGIGYDTGLKSIQLIQPRMFAGDTSKYWYKFPPPGYQVSHLNGWQYVYGVSAFDKGDTTLNIGSLESRVELRRVVPGTAPTSQRTKEIGVYPNPYYVNAAWDGSDERLRKIYFYNLPRVCEIRVYTLAGDIVAEMLHDASTYDGSEIKWFQRFGGSQIPVQFAGGEHAWDLVTRFDQAIATGMYLFSVKDRESGEIKTGKFVIIK